MPTPKVIATLLLSIAYLPNCPITAENKESVINSYAETLGDLSDDLLSAAIQAYKGTATFFPTPGAIRSKAMELQMLAMGIPTPAEAWATVLRGPAIIEAVLCKEGYDLKNADEHDLGKYWKAVWDYKAHLESCDICNPTSKEGSYGSKVVDEVVRLMGGRNAIFTDNQTADRARFLQAYQEIVEREKNIAGLTPKVREVVQEARERALHPGQLIHQLTEKVSK